MRLSLRKGERLFVNGAVMRVHARTQIEFLNDVQFLLEAHVMQEEEVTTPAAHLYYQIQILLIELGSDHPHAYRAALRRALSTCPADAETFARVDALVGTQRYHEAMKNLRPLITQVAA